MRIEGRTEGVSPTDELAETCEEMADKRAEGLEGDIVTLKQGGRGVNWREGQLTRD